MNFGMIFTLMSAAAAAILRNFDILNTHHSIIYFHANKHVCLYLWCIIFYLSLSSFSQQLPLAQTRQITATFGQQIETQRGF